MIKKTACAALLWAISMGLHAEILSAGPSGFNIRHTAELPAAVPTAVWTVLLDPSRWWDSEHTYSGDARNLTLEPHVGGCFCEKLGLYAGVEHLRVVHIQPGKMLRLSGALGPLQQFGISGSLTWQIEPLANGSRLTLTYNAGGFADRPMADWAPQVDEMLGAQVQRLTRLINTGSPDVPANSK
ncbi:MAG TPA: hypothetical protein VFS47_10905 [Steroidobacteraceae bacterium]|jgi:hypothetical protein|nr:hypothetical protein [Steroidobacteraceae bacterium]